jgi:uncharacterized repeat protein (TIGR01451 family)
MAGYWVASVAPTAHGQLRLPAIDPSGQRILLPAPNYTTLNSNVDPATGRQQLPLLDHLLHRNRAAGPAGPPGRGGQTERRGLLHGQSTPAFASPAFPPDCPEGLMPNAAEPQLGEYVPPGSVAPRVIIPGKCQDPSTAAQDSTKGFLGHTKQPSHPQSIVTLSPARQIAPVGSEVVLISGICDGSGYYQMRAPVEWTIAQGSVGHFVDPGRAYVGHSPVRRHLGTYFSEPLPELLSNNYAIGETSRKVQVLTRGTTETSDDLIVESGQTWIGLSSPLEGTTYVTVMAPYLDGWTQRTQTAVVHWIDGQWAFPSPAIVQGIQPYTLTTTLQRKVTSGAIFGWIVRYEVLDATATFDDGTTSRDVLTDSTGAASIQIVPIVPTGGSTQVRIQIIRPARGGERDPLVLGEGTTRVTWTTSQVTVDIAGPESVELNDSPTYRITVGNPGTLAASNVRIRAMVPVGFQVTGASPIGQQVGSRLDWALAELRPAEEQVFEITYRATQSGTARHCVNVQAEGGAPIEDCLTTEVTTEALFIEMRGPDPEIPLQVNQDIEYQVSVVNRGDRPLTDVLVTDRFDPGLAHREGAGPIEWPLGRLDPGESRQLGLSFRIIQEGRHCHTLEATATGTPPARTSACVTAQPAARTDLSVTKIGPSQMTEGERDVFYVEIVNNGDVSLSNLQVVDQFGPEFRTIMADPPESRAEGNQIIWYVTRLAPGEKRTFQVTCQAMFGNVDRACTDVFVRTADGLERTDRKCLPILPAAGRGGTSPTGESGLPSANDTPLSNASPLPDRTTPAPRGASPLPGNSISSSSATPSSVDQIDSPAASLELTLDSRGDSWQVGNQIDYLITIRNNRNVADADVLLTVYLPQQVQLRNYSGPVNAGDHTDDWRTFRMVPIQSVRPGEAVQFTVIVTVMQAGQFVVRVDARSSLSPEGVMRENVSVAST